MEVYEGCTRTESEGPRRAVIGTPSSPGKIEKRKNLVSIPEGAGSEDEFIEKRYRKDRGYNKALL